MTEQEKPNIATMTASELEQYVEALEKAYRTHLNYLRALARAKKAEEDAK